MKTLFSSRINIRISTPGGVQVFVGEYVFYSKKGVEK